MISLSKLCLIYIDIETYNFSISYGDINGCDSVGQNTGM